MKLIEKIEFQLLQKLEGETKLQNQIRQLFLPQSERYDFEKILSLCQTLLSSKDFSSLFFNSIKTPEDFSILQNFSEILKEQGNKEEALSILESLTHEPDFFSPVSLRHLIFKIRMTEEEIGNLKKLFCFEPFRTFSIWPNGDVCSCRRVPYIGNIYKNTFNEIWNSPKAKEIRQSIIDGTFAHCNLYNCDLYRRGALPLRKDINLDEIAQNTLPTTGDWGGANSCAQSCFWCRKEVTFDQEEKALFAIKDEILSYFINCENIYTSPSAEFSDSNFTLDLINRLGPSTPSGKTRLWGFSTNGLSFTPVVWQYIEKACTKVRLTITGRSLISEVFSSVSPNSQLDQWLQNIEFYLKKRNEGKIIFIRVKVILSKMNYREIPQFVKWAHDKGIDEVVFRRMHQWGTIDQKIMDDLDVCHPRHPENEELRNIVNSIPQSPHVIFSDIIV